MADNFNYGVFLSHSAKDKGMVRPLGELWRRAHLDTQHSPNPRPAEPRLRERLWRNKKKCHVGPAGFDLPIWHIKRNHA
jgi:hypothetical protein